MLYTFPIICEYVNLSDISENELIISKLGHSNVLGYSFT